MDGATKDTGTGGSPMAEQTGKIDLNWLRKYSQPGPRYTSYPTAPSFDPAFGEKEYRELLSSEDRKDVPLSFYFHIPFCQSVCYFCACSVIYTKKRDQVDPYVELILKEMDLLSRSLSPDRLVNQLHWGGGSPTFLTPDRMGALWSEIKKRFQFTSDPEISIELDPRETSQEHLDMLAELGFNRASIGMQDVDPDVQKAINRVQPMEEVVLPVYEKLRKLNFKGINLDLIYGLPLQTPRSFEATLDTVIGMRPDRISLFNFAYLPHLKTHQKRIREDELPDVEQRLEIFASATERFINAGYRYIGMDHFALPEDELTLAQDNGTLHRNFQGYTTRGGDDLIGVGVTSIGELADGYAQNLKDIRDYTSRLEEGLLPVERGIRRNQDDRVRHRVIMFLLCHFYLNFESIESEFGINFREYFKDELGRLSGFVQEGLLKITDRGLEVPFQGRFVIRNICMVFDARLSGLQAKGQKFSRTV